MSIRKNFWIMLKYIIFLALGIFLLWYTVKDFDKTKWDQLIFDLSHANYWLLIPVAGILLISHFLRAVRWKQLIEPLGQSPSLLNCFLCVLIGYWSNLAVPRLGEILKCTFLGRYEKIAPEKLVGTIVVERAIDVITLLIIFVITIAIQVDILGNYSTNLFHSVFQNKTGDFSFKRLGIVLLIIGILFFLLRYFLRKYKHVSVIQKIKKIFLAVVAGALTIKKIKNKKLFLVYTVAIWSMYLLSIKIGFLSLSETAHLSYGGALSVLVFGSIGMIVPSPGGIGSYQFAVQQILLLYGITAAAGMSMGMILWFALTVILILFGTISFFLLPIINKNRDTHKIV